MSDAVEAPPPLAGTETVPLEKAKTAAARRQRRAVFQAGFKAKLVKTERTLALLAGALESQNRPNVAPEEVLPPVEGAAASSPNDTTTTAPTSPAAQLVRDEDANAALADAERLEAAACLARALDNNEALVRAVATIATLRRRNEELETTNDDKDRIIEQLKGENDDQGRTIEKLKGEARVFEAADKRIVVGGGAMPWDGRRVKSSPLAEREAPQQYFGAAAERENVTAD